ncbi:MAG: hypothetical protein ACRD68_15905, partial [Pyrinomonadaceae bacterium]
MQTRITGRRTGRLLSLSLILVVVFSGPLRAQEVIDQQTIARIKTEGIQNSKVMETASYLTDVYG